MQDLFIELLQVTVGTRDFLSRVPTSIEWQGLFNEGRRQAVECVLLAGINQLPENQRPPKDVLLQWIGSVEMIGLRNALLNRRCVELQTLFVSSGFKSCILKGQGNALLYPDPLLRQSGDIDIWVEGERDAIIEFLRRNKQIKHIDVKHCNWKIFKDVPVEVHFIPSWFYNPFINKKLQNWFNNQKTVQFENKSEEGFNTPTVSFNMVYVLIHIYRHLFDEGIGLRQLMDYYYILLHSTAEERQEVKIVLDSFKMKHFVSAVMYVMQEVFMLDEEFLISQPLVKEGYFLLNEIMIAGNFGHYDIRRSHRNRGRWVNGIENIRRNMRFVSRYPQEVCWMPAWKIWHWCWRKRKGYL